MKDFFVSARPLAMILARDEGCRVGETAVVSNKVHTIDPSRPATIYIVRGADAGRTFYKRQRAGEVVHIDIFHSLARLDPQVLAKAARTGVLVYQYALTQQAGLYTSPCKSSAATTLADFVDVQSGLGGGRITGRLTYGQQNATKHIHENHVHFTMLLAPRDYALIFFLIDHVEKAIQELRSELRKVERIVHETTENKVDYDVSAYSAQSDTFLREERGVANNPAEFEYQHCLRDIADLLEELEDPESLRELLMVASPSCNKTVVGRRNIPSDTAKKLVGYKYWRETNGLYTLTEQGSLLADFLKKCGRQIECDLKPRFKVGHGRGHIKSVESPCGAGARALSPAATVTASLKRNARQQQPWQVVRDDLRYVSQVSRGKCDILLLVDASASMLGQRMKSAKVLASHLLYVTKDRVGVIYFQENKVEVAVPFTRNRSLLKAGLRQISPEGLTPLALGLERAASYLRQHASVQESLLVVITDGIPTVSQKSSDPLADALEVAEQLQQQGIKLCCIGLLPNQEILQNLARAAQGSLYVIDEITPEKLINIISKERRTVVRHKQERQSPAVK